MSVKVRLDYWLTALAKAGNGLLAKTGLGTLTTYDPAMYLADVGDVKITARTAAPSGWLLCYGQAISRTTYAALFTAISTTYGSGDGTTTFNVPDTRGRVVAGQDDMGGTSANRLTGLTGGIDGDVLGGTGGEQSHALTPAEVPAMNSGAFSVAGGAGPRVTGYAGTDGAAHNNVQPTIILNYIIFAGV